MMEPRKSQHEIGLMWRYVKEKREIQRLPLGGGINKKSRVRGTGPFVGDIAYVQEEDM